MLRRGTAIFGGQMDLCNINDINSLLSRHGFRFSKSMGQNFLVSRWVPERIAAESGADGGSGVLEIGPGVGCLTRELAKRAGKVVCVELDRRLIPLLGETLEGFDNVSVIEGDILKADLGSIVREYFPGLAPSVCANLPYNITSPVLSKLLSSGLFGTITVMVQREVALRMAAAPGTADYGAFTLLVNYYARPEILFDVPPESFLPRPKVTSSVIRLRCGVSHPEVTDEELFFKVVRAAFNQRRKTLANSLYSGLGGLAGKEEISAAIESAGLSPALRGETLGLHEFAALTNALAAYDGPHAPSVRHI